VYRAIWRGRCIAVKVVQLPAEAIDPGRDPCSDAALLTRERMAVMETVVSITMSHPNIVQVRICYKLRVYMRRGGQAMCRRVTVLLCWQEFSAGHIRLDLNAYGSSGMSCMHSFHIQHVYSMHCMIRVALRCLQVFTFALKPLPTLAASQQQQLQQLQQQQGMQQGAACGSGWELQLVMEYCDEVGTQIYSTLS
jgi:hypothetical protein